MSAEIGQFACILALLLALGQATVPLFGVKTGRTSLMRIANSAAAGQFVFLSLAMACLAYAFLVSDFSVAYVAASSSRSLPTIYKLTAIWGGHEGALLLWVWIFSVWCLAVSLFSTAMPLSMRALALAVMGMVSIGFLVFMLGTSSPFTRLVPVPLEGRDLNPLLQDPGMIIHPPLLYLGYSGFSVAFAFAIAALITGRFDTAWVRWTRPWTLMAWVFLTLGIALGSWWAYHELGWGGWWFWDPVENASFMPWLTGTALIHSLAVAEKRGGFKSWALLLAIASFSLSLLGTFLVRSGVLTSVHAFANDPARGVFILMLLVIFIGGSLSLFAWRAPQINRGTQFSLVSRETLLLLNNLFLAALTLVVLFGTLAPLIYEALGLGKISVGPPWFDLMFVCITPLMFLAMGLGPLTRWREDSAAAIKQRIKLAVIGSIVFGIAGSIPLFFDRTHILRGLGFTVFAWIVLTTVQAFLRHRRQYASVSLRDDFLYRNRSWYGMIVAHLGMAAVVIGVCCVSLMDQEKDVSLRPGESHTVAGYRFEFVSLAQLEGPNYVASQGEFTVHKGDRLIATLTPEKRNYQIQSMPMTEAGVDAGLFRDVYVSLGEPLGDSAWAVRLYYKPMVRWIWLGALLIALGGTVSALDRRYRTRAVARQHKLSAEAM